MTRCLGRGLADFSERHPLPRFAGERAFERPNAGMHTNGSSVSLHFVFQLVARFHSQGLSNFLGMVVCPLLVTVECSIVMSLLSVESLLLYYSLLVSVVKARREWELSIAYPPEAKALPARASVSTVL